MSPNGKRGAQVNNTNGKVGSQTVSGPLPRTRSKAQSQSPRKVTPSLASTRLTSSTTTIQRSQQYDHQSTPKRVFERIRYGDSESLSQSSSEESSMEAVQSVDHQNNAFVIQESDDSNQQYFLRLPPGTDISNCQILPSGNPNIPFTVILSDGTPIALEVSSGPQYQVYSEDQQAIQLVDEQSYGDYQQDLQQAIPASSPETGVDSPSTSQSSVVPSTAMTMLSHSVRNEHELDLPPMYVNAKQYPYIMKRRKAREKLVAQGRLPKSRQKYLHESRHLHALGRQRGEGGKFDSHLMLTPTSQRGTIPFNGNSQMSNSYGATYRYAPVRIRPNPNPGQPRKIDTSPDFMKIPLGPPNALVKKVSIPAEQSVSKPMVPTSLTAGKTVVYSSPPTSTTTPTIGQHSKFRFTPLKEYKKALQPLVLADSSLTHDTLKRL